MNKTGLIYDNRMTLHETYDHPEQPDRIRSIYKMLVNEGLVDSCHVLPIRYVTNDELI